MKNEYLPKCGPTYSIIKICKGSTNQFKFQIEMIYLLTAIVLTTGGSSTVQYSTVQYSTVQYSAVQYSRVQYSTVQYSTVQYSTHIHTNST